MGWNHLTQKGNLSKKCESKSHTGFRKRSNEARGAGNILTT
jgi:hypothetical protein